ncbi:MAG: hypothetical protein Q8Q33_01040 [Chlamydiota bacterium]|nr:hypothetical protein [Chlamydiota bacterium]
MRGVIKSVLAEELANSLRMKKEYEMALGKLPEGCLAVKKIRGHKYGYLVKRIGEKVKYIYIGKISKELKMKYDEAKEMRAKYRKLLSQVKKQIKFLRGSLRGKEAI